MIMIIFGNSVASFKKNLFITKMIFIRGISYEDHRTMLVETFIDVLFNPLKVNQLRTRLASFHPVCIRKETRENISIIKCLTTIR